MDAPLPSHGHQAIHLIAKTRAEKGGRLIERWSSLAYIKKNLAERYSKEITKWHGKKTQGKLVVAAAMSPGRRVV